MLGDFLTRWLMMILGYVYPAFECYKAVEKNRVEIEQLRFWCQYWIIVAALTVLERFGDIFVSWLPLYGEMKVAFIVYLWSSKTKGTSYVYETFLRPYIAMYETDIDRNLMELRARGFDFAISYWQNFLTYGQSAFYTVLQYLAAQSTNVKENRTQKSSPRQPDRQKTPPKSDKQRRPSVHFNVSPEPKAEAVLEPLRDQSEKVDLVHSETLAPESDIARSISAARNKLKRRQ